jgi:hypothetical protein
MVAAAVIGAGVLGAGASIYASNKAANTQADAAQNAANINQQQYQQTRTDLQPYVQGGYGAQTALNNLLGIGTPSNAATYGQLTHSFTPADYLANQDPGYQFQLQQGQQALQNSQAAQNGVLSGAALKGLIGFNQGMAATGYNDAFNRWQTQNQNVYNRLAGLLQVGENAGAQTGTIGANLAGNSANAVMSGGNALAAGQVGMANAINGGINNATGYYMLNNMSGGKLFGTGSGAVDTTGAGVTGPGLTATPGMVNGFGS